MDTKLYLWSLLSRVALCLIFLAHVQPISESEVQISMQFIVTSIVGFNAVFLYREFRKESAISPLLHRYIYAGIAVSLYGWLPTFHAPFILFNGSWDTYSCWCLAVVIATFLLDHAYTTALNLRTSKRHLRYYCERIEERWKIEAHQGDGNSQLELVELHLNRLGNYELLKAHQPQADKSAIDWLRRAQKNPDNWTQKETLKMIEKAKLIIGAADVEYWLSEEE